MNKQICRLCLAYSSVYISLFENNLSEILETLTLIKINLSDASTVSCLKCVLNMKLAFKIQQNIIKSNENFKELCISNDVNVKLESEIDIVENCLQPDYAETVTEGNVAKHEEQPQNNQDTCDICDTTFSNIEEYKTHLNKHSCFECGTNFNSECLYNNHLKQAYEKGCEGPSTRKTFPSKTQLMNHTQRRKKCPVRSIKSNFSGPQTCNICGAPVSSLQSLKSHLHSIHSNTSFTCEECGVVFNKPSHYINHKKRHEEMINHGCDRCGKAFLTKALLNKHIKTAHLILRPFICEYCEMACSTRCSLKIHVRQHTNETPFNCEVCGQRFRQNVSLKTHLKLKHAIA